MLQSDWSRVVRSHGTPVVTDRYKARGYSELVAMLRTGPPWCTQRTVGDGERQRELRPPRGRAPRERRGAARPRRGLRRHLWKVLGFGAGMAKRQVKGVVFTIATPDAARGS